MNTLAGELARALGDVDAMQQLYADDISWTLPVTLGRIGGTNEGKDAVIKLNKISFGPYSKSAGFKVDIHHEFGDDEYSVARFTCSATVSATDEAYVNEYSLFVRGRDGKITEVVEHLDTLKVMHYEGLRTFLPRISGVVVS
ncbi:nuclear transport factor 2 family protein [Rhodococcus opacus]|uniref:nuclear transport factor 2 family protein n=1 Tax=Rhodococcus koreensis TaxID=99653 RepID=UPI00197E406F|nr:nuclear transport factor 2 family protein [Rhodococcus koreensis]MDT2006590.1 nuclear transport factor 2 family protein [Rhodococcus opacus]QSE86367.1 nuclear transport factor 2 family protein [Rhodococcus koreensis]